MLNLSRVTFKPSKLEPWQKEDARRLKQLFNTKRAKGISQSEFGAKFDIGNQGMVWQYLNAKRPLNIRVTAAFARGLGVQIADISPKLAAQLDAMNANPRLREFFEECSALTDALIETLKTMAVSLRGKTSK